MSRGQEEECAGLRSVRNRGQEESCRRQAGVGAEKMWSKGQEEDLDSAVHWR